MASATKLESRKVLLRARLFVQLWFLRPVTVESDRRQASSVTCTSEERIISLRARQILWSMCAYPVSDWHGYRQVCRSPLVALLNCPLCSASLIANQGMFLSATPHWSHRLEAGFPLLRHKTYWNRARSLAEQAFQSRRPCMALSTLLVLSALVSRCRWEWHCECWGRHRCVPWAL